MVVGGNMVEKHGLNLRAPVSASLLLGVGSLSPAWHRKSTGLDVRSRVARLLTG